jgi:hypothetical protein
LRFKEKFLFCVVADEDLSKISWDSQDHLTRKVLIQRSDALFSNSPAHAELGLGTSAAIWGRRNALPQGVQDPQALHQRLRLPQVQ